MPTVFAAAGLIAIMQDIQAEYKYLSPAVLERIAQKLGIGVAKVYSVATFYENFSLEAKGKYIIKVSAQRPNLSVILTYIPPAYKGKTCKLSYFLTHPDGKHTARSISPRLPGGALG